MRWKVIQVKVPRCPFCGATSKQRCYSTDGSTRYYQCGVCVYPGGDGTLTRYKAIVG